MTIDVLPLDSEFAARIARLAMDGIHREYPNKIAHVMTGDADARTPRALTPMFFGCFDWHSAVHSHWCLIRLRRCLSEFSNREAIRGALETSFTLDHAAGEMEYLAEAERSGFPIRISSRVRYDGCTAGFLRFRDPPP